jgi:hypothetical protein
MLRQIAVAGMLLAAVGCGQKAAGPEAGEASADMQTVSLEVPGMT